MKETNLIMKSDEALLDWWGTLYGVLTTNNLLHFEPSVYDEFCCLERQFELGEISLIQSMSTAIEIARAIIADPEFEVDEEYA